MVDFREGSARYARAVKELCDAGFTVNGTDAAPQLLHEEYGITVPLQGNVATLLSQVETAEYEWIEHKDAPAAVMSPKEEEMPAAPAPARATNHKPGLPFALPDPQKTILVFDTSVLGMLEMSRAGLGDDKVHTTAHKWLDILKQTAKLPNVTIVVPSFIADWEMQGRTALFSEDGKSVNLRQVETKSKERNRQHYDRAKTMSHFFESASRARLDSHGQLQVIEGANKNIIIWESSRDRQLQEKINRIDTEVANPSEKWRIISTEINHNDEGEKCTECFIKETPYRSPVILCAEDYRWFQLRKDMTTHLGFPVGHANLSAYLDAELKARGGVLQTFLKEPRKLTAAHIIDRINEHKVAAGQGAHAAVPYNTKGFYAPSMLTAREPETIEQVIQNGVDLMRGNYQDYYATNGNVLALLSGVPWRQTSEGYAVNRNGIEGALVDYFPATYVDQALAIAKTYLHPTHAKSIAEDVYTPGTPYHGSGKGAWVFSNALTDRVEAKYGMSAYHQKVRHDAEAAVDGIAGLSAWDVKKPRANSEVGVFSSIADIERAIPKDDKVRRALLECECRVAKDDSGAASQVTASDWLKEKIFAKQPSLVKRIDQACLDALERSDLPESSRQHFAAQIMREKHPGDWFDQLLKKQEDARKHPDPSVKR
jgi:hypothetical protein